MSRVYLAGPISGVDPQVCRERFAAAELAMKARGWKVIINPLMVAQMWPGLNWEEYMLIDKTLLDICDAIYLLRGWEASKGAQVEHARAEKTRKVIIYEEERGKANDSEGILAAVQRGS